MDDANVAELLLEYSRDKFRPGTRMSCTKIGNSETQMHVFLVPRYDDSEWCWNDRRRVRVSRSTSCRQIWRTYRSCPICCQRFKCFSGMKVSRQKKSDISATYSNPTLNAISGCWYNLYCQHHLVPHASSACEDVKCGYIDSAKTLRNFFKVSSFQSMGSQKCRRNTERNFGDRGAREYIHTLYPSILLF